MATRKTSDTTGSGGAGGGDVGGDDRDLVVEALAQARAALAAYEHRLSSSAELTEGRVNHFRDDVKAAVRNANTDDALLLRKVDSALGSSQKERSSALSVHKAIADDLLADLAALAEILG